MSVDGSLELRHRFQRLSPLALRRHRQDLGAGHDDLETLQEKIRANPGADRKRLHPEPSLARLQRGERLG
jgi:hypothetical protein